MRKVLHEDLIYEILAAVGEIPRGKVASYGQIARLIGRDNNARLVGNVLSHAELYGSYVSYELWSDGAKVSSGTALFCPPKHFHFADPQLSLTVEDGEIVVSAKAYARSVEIVCEDGDVVFEDNYFDLNAETRRVRILRGEGTKFSVRSVYDIR